MAPDGFSLLTLDTPSVQTAPDGYRRIVWMIKRMIKAHPIKNRMPRQASSYRDEPSHRRGSVYEPTQGLPEAPKGGSTADTKLDPPQSLLGDGVHVGWCLDSGDALDVGPPSYKKVERAPSRVVPAPVSTNARTPLSRNERRSPGRERTCLSRMMTAHPC